MFQQYNVIVVCGCQTVPGLISSIPGVGSGALSSTLIGPAYSSYSFSSGNLSGLLPSGLFYGPGISTTIALNGQPVVSSGGGGVSGTVNLGGSGSQVNTASQIVGGRTVSPSVGSSSQGAVSTGLGSGSRTNSLSHLGGTSVDVAQKGRPENLAEFPEQNPAQALGSLPGKALENIRSMTDLNAQLQIDELTRSLAITIPTGTQRGLYIYTDRLTGNVKGWSYEHRLYDEFKTYEQYRPLRNPGVPPVPPSWQPLP